LLQGAFETGDLRRADVLLDKVSIGHNRVTNIGAVQRCFQPAGLAQLAAPLDFVAFRILGFEVRVAELRVVQVIEGGRAEAFAVRQEHIVVGIQRHAQAGAPGVVATELLVLVMTHAQFGRKIIAMKPVLNKRCAVPAAVLVKSRAAAHAVLIGVGAEDQAVFVVQRQVVLPVQRVAVGIETVDISAELVPGFFAVFTVAQFQARIPALTQLRIDKAADAADIKIAVKLLAADCHGARVPAPERVIEFGFANVFHRCQPDFKVFVQVVAQVQAQRLVAIGIVIVVAGEGLVGAVDARRLLQAATQVVAGLRIATGDADAVL